MSCSPSEKQIENQILSYLAMVPNCLAWKNENVGVYDAAKGIYRRLSRHRMKGISDILGIYHGRMLCIEVKTPTGRVSPDQKHFIQEMDKLGAIAFVARSLDEVMERLPRLGPSPEHTSAGI